MKQIVKYALAAFLLISLQGSCYGGIVAQAKTEYKSEKVHKIRYILSVAAGITGASALYTFFILMLSHNRPNQYSVVHHFCKNLHGLNFPGVHVLEDGAVEFTATTLKTFLGYGLGVLLAGALIAPTTDQVDNEETTLEIAGY